MSFRYLLGPADTAWITEHLSAQRQAGACLGFHIKAPADLIVEPEDTWETLRKPFPGDWTPDVLFLDLPSPLPPGLWAAPLPIIGLARNPDRHWHAVRRLARHCDLVLTDSGSAEALRREGITSVRAANFSGLGQSWLDFPWQEDARDIDVLLVSDSKTAQQHELPLAARLAALRPQCNVVIAAANVAGDEYRRLLARTRIVVCQSRKGERQHQNAETIAAGALLFQAAGHDGEGQASLLDREECVVYEEGNLELLLRYYLSCEEERRSIADRARQRLQQFSFASQWEALLAELNAELPALRERAAQRLASGVVPDFQTRVTAQLAAPGGPSTTLVQELMRAVQDRPRDPHLCNALAALACQSQPGKDAVAALIPAAHLLQEAWHSDPRHVVAGLNLAEVLIGLNQRSNAADQACRTLAMLDELGVVEPGWLAGPCCPAGSDLFQTEWERAAWKHAGQPRQEAQAKIVLLRWRLHSLQAQLRDDVVQAFMACMLRPDLPVSQAALGCALARKGRMTEAVASLRAAVSGDPFDNAAARALYEALGHCGLAAEQQQLSLARLRLSEAASKLVPVEPWFADAAALPVPMSLADGKKRRMVWRGSQEALHSLALVNREACQRLAQRGHELSLQPAQSSDPPGKRVTLPPVLQACWQKKLSGPAEVCISHQWPPDFTPPRNGHWVVMQPWEYGSLPRAWIEPLTKQVDEVWVPSRFVRDGFIHSGIPADKVFVVPNGVSDLFLRGGHAPYALQTTKRFKFLFVGGTIERKGIDILLKAYTETFSDQDDVCLVVKDMGVGSFYRGQTAEPMIAKHRQAPHAPAIEYLANELSEEEMAGLYAASDCLVHPYRGEGFGLPIAEAMASGLPVIVTGYGAALDFCRDEHAYLLPARVAKFPDKRVGELETVDHPWWADPDMDMLRYLLRHVVERGEEAKAKGKHAQAFIRAHFTWEQSVLKMEQRLQELCQRPLRRQRYAPAAVPSQSSAPVQATAPPPPRVSAPAAAPLVRKKTGRPRVSLTMIVKNEEQNLPACLQSVADLVDEIIVVDTGSTDATKQIAADMGAKVFDFPWIDSFSAARNESLRHATGDWVLWMDADDRIDEENRRKLAALFEQLPTGNVGYVLKCLCPPNADTGASTVVDHVRLFRNHPQIRWSYRIHEQILPAIRRLGGKAVWGDVVIQHVGYIDGAVRKRKQDRDLRLLRLEYQEQPHDPFTLFNLAQVVRERGNLAEALELLQGSLRRSAPEDSITRKLYALIAHCHREMGHARQALEACTEARRHFDDDVEIFFHEALARRELGDRPGAIDCLQRILTLPQGNHFASFDPAIRGYKTRHVLAIYLLEEGRPDEAEKEWNLILAERPGFVPGLLGLADVCLLRQNWRALDEILARLQAMGSAGQEVFTFEARKHLAQREFSLARQSIDKAITLNGQAVWPQVILADILWHEGKDWQATEKALRDVLALEPNHAETRRKLDVLLREHGKSLQ